jgi:Fe2+ or Zn2+ uptake regulation protein
MLHRRGFKATPGRIALLQVLKRAGRPLSISQISKELRSGLDQATIYRALEALTDSGVVRKVDFQHSHAYYELIEGNPHHHHLLCQGCGRVEDVTRCDPERLEQTILCRSRNFKEIYSHTMEFFGRCKSCVRT